MLQVEPEQRRGNGSAKLIVFQSEQNRVWIGLSLMGNSCQYQIFDIVSRIPSLMCYKHWTMRLGRPKAPKNRFRVMLPLTWSKFLAHRILPSADTDNKTCSEMPKNWLMSKNIEKPAVRMMQQFEALFWHITGKGNKWWPERVSKLDKIWISDFLMTNRCEKMTNHWLFLGGVTCQSNISNIKSQQRGSKAIKTCMTHRSLSF